MGFHNKGKNVVKFICIMIASAILTWSCGDLLNTDDYQIKSIEATPSYSVPLAFGDLSIQDVLSKQDSQYVKVYPDGLVYLSYDQVLKSQAIRNLITIPDKNNVMTSLAVPPGMQPPVPNDISSTASPMNVDFDLAPKKLTEILLKSGTLNCDVTLSPANPNFKYAVKVEIAEFTLVGAGTPLSIETAGVGKSFSLANYIYKDSGVPNQFTVLFTLIIKQNPNSVTILPGTTVNATISLKNIDYKYAKGFFDDQVVDLPAQTLDIKAFGSSLINGVTVSFAQPKIEFNVVNEVGVPTKIYFASLEARKQGSSLPVQISPASPVTIGFPTIMGDSSITSVAVTNAAALLNFAPTQFYYKANARINEGLSSGNNFVVDTSELKVRMHVEVPLFGHASNIKLADTLDLNLSDADKSEIIDASLKVKTTNQIPLDAVMQIYLTDDNFNVLDSLLSTTNTNLIKGSTVNASGDLVSPGIVDDIIPISSDKLEKVFGGGKVIIKARLSTSKDANGNYPDVKFKSSYKMNIILGLQVNAKVKVDL